MKKFKITAEEYDFIWSKIQSLEAENNRLKGYIKGLKEQLRIGNVVGCSEQLVCEYCNDDAKPTCCDSCLESMVNAIQKAN